MNGRRVLIVDDHPALGIALKAALEANAFETLGPVASLGELEGKLQRADVIVLDLNLVDSAGADTACQLSRMTDLPIIVFSAAVEDSDVKAELVGHAHAVVAKRHSGSIGSLLESLEHCLQG